MKSRILCILLFLPHLLLAQSENEINRQKVVDIKINKDLYFCSFKDCDSSIDENIHDCYNEVYYSIMNEIGKVYGNKNDIWEKMSKKMDTITYVRERDHNVTVICLYVKKAELKSLFSSNKETIDEKNTVEGILKLVIPAETEKEQSVLNELLVTKTMDDNYKYLSKFDNVSCRPTRRFEGVKNAYWIVYDKNKFIVALLNKSKSIDMLTGNSVDEKIYSSNLKMWVFFFE